MVNVMDFPGGERFEGYNLTEKVRTIVVTPGETVRIHFPEINKEFSPLTEPGAHVLRGQKLAEAENGFAVYSSVSGTVTELSPQNGSSYVTIACDDTQLTDPSLLPHDKKLSETDREEIVQKIREAGIFRRRLFSEYIETIPESAEKLIVNCTECEPYLDSTAKQIEEHPEEVIGGAKILLKAMGLSSAILAIEDDKVAAVNTLLAETEKSSFLSVKVVEAKYTVSIDKVLFRTLSGKRLSAGRKIEEFGYAMVSAAECAAVFRKFATGLPDIDRLVTVSGDNIDIPSVFMTPLGTWVNCLIEKCGGMRDVGGSVIDGGPISGKLCDDSSTIGYGTSAVISIVVQPQKAPSDCIRCGRCFTTCPARLMPMNLLKPIKKNKLSDKKRIEIENCLECRLCTAVCPSDIDVAAIIMQAKNGGQNNG